MPVPSCALQHLKFACTTPINHGQFDEGYAGSLRGRDTYETDPQLDEGYAGSFTAVPRLDEGLLDEGYPPHPNSPRDPEFSSLGDGSRDENRTLPEFDDPDLDEGYAESVTNSSLCTIPSIIRRGVEENGRIYPSYGRHPYGLPVDEGEQERSELQHCKFSLILNNELHLAPVTPYPQNILDLGTGTGIWAIDMADKYPSASVTGIDIAAIQPTWVPPNCSFEIDDIEMDWIRPRSTYDLIHARELLLSVRNWPRLINQAFSHLTPGSGYLELSSSYFHVRSDDGSIPPNSATEQVSKLIFEVGEAMGASATAPTRFRAQMERAGFVDIHETVYKIPTGPWAKDHVLKQIGALDKAASIDGMDAMLLRGYTKVLGGERRNLDRLLADARQEREGHRMHAYTYFYNVYGRRPAFQECQF